MKPWGCAWKLGIVVLVLAGFYTAAYFFVGGYADVELREARQAVEDAGETLSLAELAPPGVPEGENGAAAFLAAAEGYEDAEGDAVETFLEKPFEADEATVAAAEAWLERNREPFERARAALRRPAFQFDLDYEAGFEMEMTHIAPMQTHARLLRASACVASIRDRHDEAFAFGREMIQASRAQRQERLLISFLVSAALEQAGIETTRALLRRGPAPLEELEAIRAEIALLDTRESLRRALRGERAAGQAVFEAIRRDPAVWARLCGIEVRKGSIAVALMKATPDPVYRLDQARHLRILNRVIEIARRPYLQAREDWDAFLPVIESKPWYGGISQAILPVLGFVLMRAETHAANLDLARLGLAAEIHAIRHGAWPESLAALDEDLRLDASDPFDGKPYRYRRDDWGYAIWSVGPDGVDDGGSESEEGADPGDIVWRVSRRGE